MLIDPTIITARLRVTIENLFQTSNQTIFLGRNHPATMHLTACMVKRLNCIMEDLSEIVRELEPGKIDTGSLTIEEALTLESYQEIKQGLLISWLFIEGRERAIIRQVKCRVDAGRAES